MSTHSTIAAESLKAPDVLEQEIDQQRSRIDALIDDVEARLSPQRLIDQALAYGRESGGLELAERLGKRQRYNKNYWGKIKSIKLQKKQYKIKRHNNRKKNK